MGKAFDLLSKGFLEVVDEVMTQAYKTSDWPVAWAKKDAQRRGGPLRTLAKRDVQVQLRASPEQGYHFKDVLSRAQQGFTSELRETRNLWAHNKPLSSDDASRALDTIKHLLHAVSVVDSAEDVRNLRVDLQRTVVEDQPRRKVKRTKVSLEPGSGLRPWHEVIRPHDDVARGAFTVSEFAVDLHLVHTGQATSPEYGDPVEFFTRTYLTEGLRDLLSRAVRRLNGEAGASPMVNLQANFGGGKIRSMLALYHLFSGTPSKDLPQEFQKLVAANSNPDLSAFGVRRVTLVGTYLKACSPIIKYDGTEVRTLWGELAWQLGGRGAYDLIAEDDRTGMNSGEALRTLTARYSPALILIDEWVAHARQLVTDRELPSGSFETQFAFAQPLTELVRSVPGVMLVVSIPASDNGVEGHGSDIEIDGAKGQLALERLQNVIRRFADQWRPASKDESFEIVRRRLFQTPNTEWLMTISAVARSFTNLYRNNTALFPRDATSPNGEHEKRIRASYPLHLELLDRLYEDWSTLKRFQRTRGVLKLVSSIVHELSASNDASPLILPGNVPLDAVTVNTDLTQYLEDQRKPILDSDIDGSGSTAQQIDPDRPTLGQRFVTQRIACTIFMGAAPRIKSTRKGLDKQYLWLGTAVHGDTLGNFGNTIELLTQRSTYFYEDVETVWNEITRNLHTEERGRSVFDRVHVTPSSSADIPDLEGTRLVIGRPRHARRKQDGPDSAAHAWIRDAIESKGANQRIRRNTPIFLLSGKAALESLKSATHSYLTWKQVQDTSESLNLSVQQHKQTDGWLSRLDQTVADRIRDTFVRAIYPKQFDPAKPFELVADKVPDSGGRSLAERVSAKLGRENQLITDFGAAILGATLHNELGTLWHNHGEITVGELRGYFTHHTYLPRFIQHKVLDESESRTTSENARVLKFNPSSGFEKS